MANPYIGEVSFEAGDKEYTIRITTYEICTIEAEFGVSFGEIARRLADMSFITLRSVLRAALGKNTTAAAAADVIDRAGYHIVFNKVMDAYKLAFPPPEDDGETNPREGGGTGSGSERIG